jgi:UPF0755 protein
MFTLKRVLGVMVAVVLLVTAGGVLLANSLLQPVNPASTTREKFVIPSGQSVSTIAARLERDGFIRNALLFRLVVRQEGLDGKLQAGSFELSPAMSPAAVARALTQGTEDTWITITEGLRVEEIAETLAEYELSQFDKKDFLKAAEGLEGTLFPDTYLIPKESTGAQIARLLHETYKKKIEIGLAAEIAAAERPLTEVIVMASLIEREAREFQQMRHVSGILWHRIKIGMPLQVDATLQYAKGYDTRQKRWWATPLREDKQIVSAFNTYQNPGLPPRAICNPGLNAFKAALDPLPTDDLYYLHAPSGEMYFGQTLDQHNANVQRYLR